MNKIIKEKNPQGNIVYFNEDKHIYTLENGKVLVSGTKFIHSFFPKFDKEKWSKICANKNGITIAQQLKLWEDENKKSIKLGKKIHYLAEIYLKTKQFKNIENEIEQTIIDQLKIKLDILLQTYNVVWVEKIIFNNKIGGTFDLLLKHKISDKYLLLDFKTNKEIKFKNNYKENKKAFSPIQHLDNCNFIQYCLQLSLYQWLLLSENYLDSNSKVVRCIMHITTEGVNEYYPYYFSNEIEKMNSKYKF